MIFLSQQQLANRPREATFAGLGAPAYRKAKTSVLVLGKFHTISFFLFSTRTIKASNPGKYSQTISIFPQIGVV